MASVIVVGAGLAGLCAAFEAAAAGAHVFLLEKEKSLGGNSAKATSGMNGLLTPAQLEASIADSADLFMSDTLTSGHGLSDPALVRTLISGAHDAVEFARARGVSLDAVTLCGGHSVPRTHHEKPRADGKPTPVGWNLVSAMKRALEAMPDRVTILTGARVTGLMRAAGAAPGADAAAVSAHSAAPVVGVHYRGGDTTERQSLRAGAVVLTTGGFGCDHDSADSLLAEYAPQLARLPTTNGAFARGDGVKMARDAGAHLRGMEQVQVHPTGFVDPADPDNRTKFLAPEALRGVGGILLNHRGNRFTNELGRRDDVSRAMYAHCAEPGQTQCQADAHAASGGSVDTAFVARPAPAHAHLVLPAGAVAKFGPNFNFYHRIKKFFAEVAGPAGLAAHIGGSATVEAIVEELREYAAAAAGCSGDRFGKTSFPDAFDGDWTAAATTPLFVARVTPAIHYTMGGVATSAAAELLYAAGALARSDGATSLPAASPPGTAAAIGGSGTASSLPTGEVGAATTDGMRLRPIPGLFGAGEVTGGLHGGNRLAGNSLLECVVFGRIAGRNAAKAAAATGGVASESPLASAATEACTCAADGHCACR